MITLYPSVIRDGRDAVQVVDYDFLKEAVDELMT